MPNVFLFYGEEDYLLRQKVKFWQKSFQEKHGEYNLSVVDGLKTEAGSIIAECETMPFLGEKRLIIIENLPPATNVKVEEKKINALLRFLENVPDTSVVVFAESSPDKRTKFFKQLAKAAQTEEFKPLKDTDLQQWVRTEIQKREGKILPAAVSYLTAKTGNNLWLLQNEIEKLIAYTGEKPISENDIEKLVTPVYDVNIFKLTDFIGQKKSAEALKILYQLIDGGNDAVQIFNLIIRQFRIFLQIFELKNDTPANLASNLGLHPFVVQNTLKQLKFFNQAELFKAYQDLLEIDVKLKTGVIKISTTNENLFLLELEKFIYNLAKN